MKRPIVVAAMAALIGLPLRAGTLCFVFPKEKPKCSAAEGPKIAIEPADAERTWVFTSADGKVAVAGIAAPKSETIDLEDKSLRNVSLSVRGAKTRGWPSDVRVSLGAGKRVWRWEIPAKRIELLKSLRLPRGSHVLTIDADRHVAEHRKIDAAGEGVVLDVVLRPLPIVRGRIVTPKGQPVATAAISDPNGSAIAGADERGAFVAELSEPFPENLVIRAAGYGVRLVPLPQNESEVDLGTITLETGRKLTLRVRRPEGERIPVHVIVERELASRRIERTVVAERDLEADTEAVVLPDLGAADYFVTLRGKGPLEDLTVRLTIKDSDVEKTVTIAPYHLDIYAKLGTEPLRDATIDLHAAAPIPFDSEGHISATAWQSGRLGGWIASKTLGNGQFVDSPELGADPSRWDITFPARFISGRLLDAETRQPIPAVMMQLLRSNREGASYTSLRTDENGHYSILAPIAATYELTIQPPEYVPKTETFQIAADAGNVERDIALERGTLVTIEAQWPNGTAIANGGALEGVASDHHNPARMWRLDGTGRLQLAVGKDEHRTIYILPADGSFAAVRVEAPTNGTSATQRVIVPFPAGSLTVRFVSETGGPAGAGLSLRYNGEPIPQPVIYRLPQPPGRGEHGSFRLLQLPAGTYEVGVLDRQYQPAGATKTVGISAGEATVELTVPKMR